ncbi:MAG: A24 family peptidase C-terminal domain-containing protein [Candidatus Bathyarchaeia archaeon]
MADIRIIELSKVLLSFSFFLYASWSDYKSREVKNIVWVLYAPAGLLLTLIELFYSSITLLPLYGLCFIATLAFAIALFYTGAFGGADAKALICLALALPFYPYGLVNVLPVDISPLMHFFFPITVFSNSVLFAALTSIYILFRNLIWRWRASLPLFEGEQRYAPLGRKLLILLTAYKLPIEKIIEKWYIYPLEDIEESTCGITRKFILMPKESERDAIVERLSKAVGKGLISNSIWASPGLPMLIFITIGLLVAIVFGDVVWILIKHLLG